MDEARRLFQQGKIAPAGKLCDQILARQPSHIASLNMLGLIAQSSGRHSLAIKKFSQALALDEFDSACNYNIASSYQALNRRDEAVTHFKNAILLGMSDEKIEAPCPSEPDIRRLLEPHSREVAASHQKQRVVWTARCRCGGRGRCLSAMRHGVDRADRRVGGNSADVYPLRFAADCLRGRSRFSASIAKVLDFYSALAQQCFTNEYVFAQSDEETLQATRLRDLLNRKLAAGEEIPAPLLVAVASYFPLHSLPHAESILHRDWPENLADLLRVQIGEPLQEAQDRKLIPALTPIEDDTSLAVKQQYEENPYPRWTINRPEMLAAQTKPRIEDPTTAGRATTNEILIAGCGTGEHVYKTAYNYPNARILAIDISAASLAYAFRMTREAGLKNVEYAQADILKWARSAARSTALNRSAYCIISRTRKPAGKLYSPCCGPPGTCLSACIAKPPERPSSMPARLSPPAAISRRHKILERAARKSYRDNSNSRLKVTQRQHRLLQHQRMPRSAFQCHGAPIYHPPDQGILERAWPFVSRL